MSFEMIKEKYVEARNEQRRLFMQYYEENSIDSLRIVNGATSGRGKEKYNSNKKLKEFNLSNWKWIELKSGDGVYDFNCVISLNMPEKDTSTGNNHSLYDRIGLIISYSTISGQYHYYQIITDIDLPFELEEMRRLRTLVEHHFNFYNSLK